MKYIRPAVAMTAFFIIVTGLLFPILMTALGGAIFPHQASGSMIKLNDKIIGSELIGQSFAGPQYFHPRPSAAGAGYDANNSSGTNLGPTNPKLLEGVEGFDGIKQLAGAYRKENNLSADTILPNDSVTRSGSGLDPHISPQNAELQSERVAAARNLDRQTLTKLIDQNTEQAWVGIFGDPRVNVLKLNIALDELSKPR